MAYTPMKTMGAEPGLSSDWNTYLRDNIEFLKGRSDGATFSGVALTRVTNQSINDATVTSISWTAEEMDFGAWWSSGTDITVPAGAIPSGFTKIVVHVTAALTWASNGTGYRAVSIYLDGALMGTRNTSAITGETTDIGISRYFEVSAGQVITIRGTQTSTAALNVAKCDCAVVRHAPSTT